jgi:hypothetical protein
MRIFFDTEFNGFREDSRLLSIGLVAEDGRECYVEMPTRGPHLRDAAEFVLIHVVGQFGRIPYAEVSNYAEMARRVAAFLDGFTGRLELCYDWKLDWQHLESLLTGHTALLARIGANNIAGVAAEGSAGEEAARQAILACREPLLQAHHALADARALRAAWLADGGHLEQRRALRTVAAGRS